MAGTHPCARNRISLMRPPMTFRVSFRTSPHAGFSIWHDASGLATSPALRGCWKWSRTWAENIGKNCILTRFVRPRPRPRSPKVPPGEYWSQAFYKKSNFRPPDIVQAITVRFLVLRGGCNRVTHFQFGTGKYRIGPVQGCTKSFKDTRPML